MIGRILALASMCCLIACDGGAGSAERMSREELLKPETCKECHPKHYEQWSSSMHAYASTDPVFRAMNARGQREQLDPKDFCVNCHAPMAVREGKTSDGTNLDDVPDHLQGVTCYFCHNVDKVEDDHNNGLRLANDQTMRGAIDDPVDPKAHEAAYSKLHDGRQLESSKLCGSCHDVVTPKGVDLERTFIEYEHSFLSDPKAAMFNQTSDSCQGCHMDVDNNYTVIAEADNVKSGRHFHEHLWPAVDVPLSKFPHREAYRSVVEDCQIVQSLGYVGIDLGEDPESFVVQLETLAGHNQPSGAAQDRRMWLEISAFDRSGKKIYQTDPFTDDGSEPKPGSNPPFTFHDSIFDEHGKRVHMFWDAATHTGTPLPFGPRTTMPTTSGHALSIPVHLPSADPGRIELTLRMRPMGLDMLNDLVDSGDLEASVIDEMPTFTMYSTTIDVPENGGLARVMDPVQSNKPDCKRYRCMFDPNNCDED